MLPRPLISLLPLAFSLSLTAARAETFPIDLSRPTIPRSSMPLFSIGSDRAAIFLRDSHQRDLLALQSAIGFQYLRCHGLFNEEMHIVSHNSDGSLAFNWATVDRFIDNLHAAHLRPFVECGFMPEPLASGPQTIFFWKGNVTPPKSQDEWAQLIHAFAQHEIDTRGLDEVRQWYFELWNEPNLDAFWTGGKDAYFQLYATTANALKKTDSHLRVGGPATAGMAWIPDLLAFCKSHNTPIDFVSSHSYAAAEGFLDAPGKSKTTLVTTPAALVTEFQKARRDIQNSSFPTLPLFITEWGPSYSPRDPTHDSYICAPFILEKLQQCDILVDGMSYWAFSDQFEEPGPPTQPFHGGFGLLNVDGLRKPAFFAYQFLAQLYPSEIPVHVPRIIATKDGQKLRILLWNYSPPKADAPNDPFFTRDLPATPLPDARLSFSSMHPGTYKVSRTGVGYHRNDVYDAYLALNLPLTKTAHLSPDQLATLREASAATPEPLPDLIVPPTRTATLTLPMRTNDVWLLTLDPK